MSGLAAGCLVFSASPPEAADLLVCYREAAATSPETARRRALVRARSGDRDAARGRLLPSLVAEGSVGRNDLELEGFGPRINENYTSVGVGVRVNQPLINARDWALLEQASQRLAGSSALVAWEEQLLMIAVARHYFGVLRAEADVRVADAERDVLNKAFEQAEAAHNVGTGDLIAVKEARARLDGVLAELVRARNRVKIARRQLQQLTHSPVGELLDVSLDTPLTPAPADPESWVRTALSAHPLREERRAGWRASQAQAAAAARERYPTVDIEAGALYRDGYLLPDAMRREFTVGLQVDFPLFQGGAIAARTRAARAEADAAWESFRSLDDRIIVATRSAFLVFENSAAEYSAATQALRSAQSSLEASRKAYRTGTRSLIDYLASVHTHTAARASYFRAMYGNVLARLELELAAGTLHPDHLAAVNGLLVSASRQTNMPGDSADTGTADPAEPGEE
jgi:outer membrane protein